MNKTYDFNLPARIFTASLRNGALPGCSAVTAPIATVSVAASPVSTNIATVLARAAAGSAESAAATSGAATPTLAFPLSLVLPLPRECFCADIPERCLHGIGLRRAA